MKKFIFDVDGTLTPSRKKIEHEFWAPFLIFCRHHDVYLVTGSDRQKTLEQLGLIYVTRRNEYIIVLVVMCMKKIRMFIEIHGNHLMK